MKSVAILITCHNRAKKTLACLSAINSSFIKSTISTTIYLVDDGSTDNTREHVAAGFPSVIIIRGDGDLFWNGGMHIAFEAAMQQGYDAYLWLNDDTLLEPDAISRMLDTYQHMVDRSSCQVIVVGATHDDAGKLSYGGAVSASSLRRFNYRKVWDAQNPVECEVMNGNCVLIPDVIARKVGNIDNGFEHAMGDIDYALRARNHGFHIFVVPGFVGHCTNNPVANTFNDRSLGLAKRWKLIVSRKGLPPKSWLRFTRRHGGLVWPVYFVWPYLKLISSSLLHRVTK